MMSLGRQLWGQIMSTILFGGGGRDKVTLSEFFFPYEVVAMRRREERKERERGRDYYPATHRQPLHSSHML